MTAKTKPKKKMGRPPTGANNVSAKVDRSIIEAAKKIAQSKRVNVSDILNRSLAPLVREAEAIV